MNSRALQTKLQRHHKLDSTNLEAERILSDQQPAEGTVILSDFQEEGHGLGRNTWNSQPGKNILISIILYPHFLPPQHQFMLNKVTSLAVLKCVEAFVGDLPLRIKWPNDVYAGMGKIAGILIKNTISGLKLRHTIVGIGLNVNQVDFDADLPNPVSMAGLTGSDIDREAVLTVLLDHFSELYDQLRAGDHQAIDNAYLGALLNFNRPALYEEAGKRFNGIIRGVDEFGRLQVDTGSEMKFFDMKEIKFITE